MNDIDSKLQKSVLFIQRGLFKEAAEAADDVLKRNPRHFDGLHLRALASFYKKDIVGALRDIEAAISIRKDFPDALNTYGIILKAHGRYDDAVKQFKAVLDRKPNHKEALYNIGNCHQDRAEFDAAIHFYDKALRLDHNFIAALNNKGLVLGKQGNHTAALTCFSDVIGKEPRFAEGYYNRGDTFAALKDYEAAIRDYDTATRLRPFFPSAHCNRANCLREMGMHADARSGYDKAIAQDPQFAEAYVSKAVVLSNLGQIDDAIACLDTAIQLKPHYAEAYVNRGNALKERNRLDEALASYDKAISLRPDYSEAYRNRGVALSELRRLDEALASYGKAISLRPNKSAAIRRARGELLIKLKRYEEALDDYERSIDQDESNEDSYVGKALCLNKLGRQEECLATLAEARSRFSTSETFNYRAAALEGDNSIPTAPKKYVKELFDDYAHRFERHLLGGLTYAAPEKMYRQFEKCFEPHPRDCLDLGCGTGLGGIAYRKCIRSIIGIDLSERMLDEARKKDIYAQLISSDIVEFLNATENKFDLVISFDAFIYSGSLDEIFEGVRRVLRPGGIFAFSTEVSETSDFELKPTARYGHSRSYIEQLASKHRFKISAFERDIIRRESGADLDGYLVHLALE